MSFKMFLLSHLDHDISEDESMHYEKRCLENKGTGSLWTQFTDAKIFHIK